jgi:hypothetical protein
MTHYLRFPDAVAGMAALDDAGLLDDGLNPITASHSHALDVVGAIAIGGEYDPETGEALVPPTLLDGWHVNYAGELPEGWADYAVSPEQPVRVFAG